jgi:hypothetical protein
VAIAAALAIGFWKGWPGLSGSLTVHANNDNATQPATSPSRSSALEPNNPVAKENGETGATATQPAAHAAPNQPDPALTPEAAPRDAKEGATALTASLADTNSGTKTPAVGGSVAPVAPQPPAAKAPMESVAPAAAPTSAFENVKVQGIFYADSQRSVIINGKLLGQSERIGNVQVIFISPTSVVLSCNGQQRTFKVK